MPILFMFYGIMIHMNYADNKQHHVPQIHAEFGGDKGVFEIQDGILLAGRIPTSKSGLGQVRTEIHREEPFANWLSTARKPLRSTL